MEKRNTYRRLFTYLRPYQKQVFLTYFSMLLGIVAKLGIPILIGRAIDNGLDANDSAALLRTGQLILLLALISGVVSFVFFYYSQWLGHRVAYSLRKDFYEATQRLPFSFHDKAQTGDLMSRVTSDIQEARFFVGPRFAELCNILITIVGTVVAMIWLVPTLALLALIPIPLLIAATIRFGGIVRPMFKHVQEQLGRLSSTMQESLTGISVVKAFARESYELEKFDDENMAWYHGRVSVVKQWADNWPLFVLLVSTSIGIVLYAGGPQVISGDITVGEITSLIQYILMLQAPVQSLGFVVNLAATAGSAASRVFETIDAPNEVADLPDAQTLRTVAGKVEFRNVSFAYGNEQRVLHDISFEVQPGQRIALVGATGSGKSTVMNLLARFYEPQQGSIYVDGIDISGVSAESLRNNIGTVLQDTFLFSSTIGLNIAYGNLNASKDEIIAAAKAACADNFIMGFPEGYETAVGERGVTLSGGQKQRVAIARALLTDPAILVLDDATSSVDTATEFAIQQALDVLMDGRTTFVIAQRLLTLKSADLILVLDHGRIVERGTHHQLLAQNGPYREIYDLQLKDQEEFAARQVN
ncbi:MAG: ABC transporter ATP-binding protein [Candidatus Promineifilaceae bacterium]